MTRLIFAGFCLIFGMVLIFTAGEGLEGHKREIIGNIWLVASIILSQGK